MSALKIAGTFPPDKHEGWKKRMAEAQGKQLSAGEEAALLKKIRNGDRALIDKLVDSQETVILSVIKPFLYKGSSDIEEMLETGKIAWRKLAEGEVGSAGKERFFRFGVWVVRQAVSDFKKVY